MAVAVSKMTWLRARFVDAGTRMEAWVCWGWQNLKVEEATLAMTVAVTVTVAVAVALAVVVVREMSRSRGCRRVAAWRRRGEVLKEALGGSSTEA